MVSSIDRWGHVGPEPQAEAVMVYRRRPSHAATPVHAVTDQESKFARFQIRPDCERLPPRARYLERRSDYHHRPLETREANGLRRLKVLNIKPL